MRVSVVLDLLDNQVVDSEGVPLGRVDDLELCLPVDVGAPSDERARVTAVVIGAAALGRRLGGITGRVMTASAERLRPAGSHGPTVEVSAVRVVRPLLRLTVAGPALPGVAGLEKWLRRHVVERGERR